jgi:SAM-dependent methyltransferase
MESPWRKLSYRILHTLEINGSILDIGGFRESKYHKLIQGKHFFEVVNIDATSERDYNFNLEEEFPLASSVYDGVIAINVLEHIYNYTNVFSESARVLKRGGTFVIAVPFFMFVHPSPRDHWRFTKETLVRLLEKNGFVGIEVLSVGRGPGAVFVQAVGGVRGGGVLRMIVSPFMWLFDKGVSLFMSQKELRERFPLGYVVTAKKKL